MILTITLNPSIDRRYNINGFEKGKVFRAEDYQYTIGGKGLNVTKVIKSLSESVIATGFIGGNSGNFISSGLTNMGIEHNFININGETRSCLGIISDDGSQTEILERGPFISKNENIEFYNLYEILLDKADIVCASGSLPCGLALETYRDMIKIAKKKGKKFILDTSGEALRLGIEAAPTLIKPNKEELESLTGISIESSNQLIKAGKDLLDKGIEIVAISLGQDGSMVFHKNNIYKITVPKVKVLNPIGSGDSMIAGFAVSMNRGYDFETMLKIGAACGTANAMENETGKVDQGNMYRVMEDIVIEKIR